MNMTRVEIVADSVNVLGNRLITMEMVYPRIIHAEIMSYCSFARNANSSRAMTPGSVIKQVRDEGFVPEIWRRADLRGMVPKGRLDSGDAQKAEEIWIQALMDAVRAAEALDKLKVARELTNRVLEPFAWMRTLVTASWPNWANFLHQRTAREAQHEIKILANKVGLAIAISTPIVLDKSQWHAPYADLDEPDDRTRLLLSVARCARVSYKAPRQAEWAREQIVEADIGLAMRLQRDAHWSPFEHQALCWVPNEYKNDDPEAVPAKLRGKFCDGWVQHRKTISGECYKDFNLKRIGSKKEVEIQVSDRSTVNWNNFSRELALSLAKTLNLDVGS